MWDEVEENLAPTPQRFFFECLDILTTTLFEEDRGLFVPKYLGAASLPRPQVYVLPGFLIAPPYITGMYLPPFRNLPGRLKISIELPEKTEDSLYPYIEAFKHGITEFTDYDLSFKDRYGIQTFFIKGPKDAQYLDDVCTDEVVELDDHGYLTEDGFKDNILPKPYDVSSDDSFGYPTDFDITPYDPDKDGDGGLL